MTATPPPTGWVACRVPHLTAMRPPIVQVMDVERADGLEALELCNGMRKLVRRVGWRAERGYSVKGSTAEARRW